MSDIQQRPNSIGLFLIGGIIGLPLGLMLSGIFPEGSSMRVLAGMGGIVAPPVAMLVKSSKKWAEYVEHMQKQYELAKDELRRNPSNVQARETMLQAGRTYYSCMRENGTPTIYDEQAINNDMNAILG